MPMWPWLFPAVDMLRTISFFKSNKRKHPPLTPFPCSLAVCQFPLHSVAIYIMCLYLFTPTHSSALTLGPHLHPYSRETTLAKVTSCLPIPKSSGISQSPHDLCPPTDHLCLLRPSLPMTPGNNPLWCSSCFSGCCISSYLSLRGRCASRSVLGLQFV